MSVSPDVMERVAGVRPIPDPLYDVVAPVPDEVKVVIAALKLDRVFLGTRKGCDGSDISVDRMLVEPLIGAGITNPVDLMSVCANRVGHGWAMLTTEAQERLRRNLSKLIHTMLTAHSQRDAARPKIARVVIYQSAPPSYDIHTELGPVFRCTMADLMSPTKFAQRYAEACRVIPVMPKKAADWTGVVNDWLATAELVEQPEDASEDGHAEEVVRDVLTALPVSDEATMDRYNLGNRIQLDDRVIVKSKPLLRRVQVDLPRCTATDLARILRKLGCEPTNNVRIDGHQVRGWVLSSALGSGEAL
jgi:hypothetical protein